MVTSLAEVWIEIQSLRLYQYSKNVTSLAEVWIEIYKEHRRYKNNDGHFPCGSVD